MQCTNTGVDDRGEPQWDCSADIPRAFRLGRTDVSCEGYSKPTDPYILRGSCGVEYELWRRPDAEANYIPSSPQQPFTVPKASEASSGWSMWSVVAIVSPPLQLPS